ncbi:hypothetical protein IMG5_074790 [Ichthyophthirius multifiliis]|uniref:GOLD domain-containing protein n=1 Tax=Ichthyophthirius multifiliis TaxID=5932 RepID=G0QQ29_ICHMU|nr:hypothetical protein IMG5_074790 [Ichthyophthirius multifiliis]EGR32671.1 hypothetical protein IMG5_074790 [Ichthyophthirius multifiliis]|eukprot:XP_004036657.1 hypothetical protein IMG5_074790 [Ichthyophthirius multifiliis]
MKFQVMMLKISKQYLNSISKLVSFEFQKSSQVKFVGDKDIQQTETLFDEAEQGLQYIYQELHHQSIREKTHKQLIVSTENKLSICSFIKIIVLICVFGVQLYAILSWFKDGNYKPVVQVKN